MNSFDPWPLADACWCIRIWRSQDALHGPGLPHRTKAHLSQLDLDAFLVGSTKRSWSSAQRPPPGELGHLARIA